MSSQLLLQEEELSCPLCGDILREPVVLSCGHRFCQACLEDNWRLEAESLRECLLCRRRSSTDRPPVSAALRRSCEALRRERSRSDPTVCVEHGGTLALFCLEDLRPVCAACRTSQTHGGHRLYPATEAVLDCKEELKTALKPLLEKLKALKKAKLICDQSAEHIQIQAQCSERQIREQFEKLHQFLRDEEMARVAALREEEEQKSRTLRQQIEELAGEMSSLSGTIWAIEQEMEAEDISFLLNYKDTIKRAWAPFRNPDVASGMLIDVAKHLGSLTFRVWEKMMKIVQYTPVTLDPNTAASCFQLSQDLSAVQCYTERFHLPDNPERFDLSAEILGWDGFVSGRHSWDVEVRDNTYWVVGVAKESVHRKGKHVLTPAEGVWAVRLRDGEYKACTAPWTPLVTALGPPRVIRVLLDMDRATVSFSDPRERTPLYTFTKILAPRVLPYFCTACRQHPLTVLPVRISVTMEQHC